MPPELIALLLDLLRYVGAAAVGGAGVYMLWIGKAVIQLDREKVGHDDLSEAFETFKEAVGGLRAAVDKQFDSNIEMRDEVSAFKTDVAGQLGEVKGALRAMQQRNGMAH